MRRIPLLLLLLVLLVLGWGWGCERTMASGGCCPPGFEVTSPCTHTADPAGNAVTGVPSPITPRFGPQEATGNDIIPVYCSLLAAVVVGLLAYVAFKCWNTCRQKKQLGKARPGDMGTSSDVEKLRGDGGVILNNPKLQEPSKAPCPEGPLLGGVSPQQQQELEQLLENGAPGGDWRSLATALGFGPEAIGTFSRGRTPTRTLLSTWAATDGATLDTFCQALATIGRQDVAQHLVAPEDVTSMV